MVSVHTVLEDILLTHPAVAEAAVVPSPDERAGEVPKAFVVLRRSALARELIAWVAEQISPLLRWEAGVSNSLSEPTDTSQLERFSTLGVAVAEGRHVPGFVPNEE